MIRKKESAGGVLRAQAVLLVNDGAHASTIKQLTGYGRRHAFLLKSRYLEIGIEALDDKRLGSPKELLTKKQRAEVRDILKSKTPKDLGYAHDHWTTGLLGHWIEREYRVRYKSKTSYYILFRQAEFTYHKPERRYHERDEAEVKRWAKVAKPQITAAWHEPNTIVLAADEMILTTKTTIQKVWLPKGGTPTVDVPNTHVERRNVYGFLNLKTGQEHVWKTTYQNMHVTADILKELRTIYPKQKIVLCWDNAGWHRGSVVRDCIKQDKNITVIHFPRYAPEENPQEHVWKRGRSMVTHNRFIEDIDQATDEFVAYLNRTIFPYSLLGFGATS